MIHLYLIVCCVLSGFALWLMVGCRQSVLLRLAFAVVFCGAAANAVGLVNTLRGIPGFRYEDVWVGELVAGVGLLWLLVGLAVRRPAALFNKERAHNDHPDMRRIFDRFESQPLRITYQVGIKPVPARECVYATRPDRAFAMMGTASRSTARPKAQARAAQPP